MSLISDQPCSRNISVTWIITTWGGSTKCIRNFSLRRSQVRNRANIGLNQCTVFIHPFLPLSLNLFIFVLFNSKAKEVYSLAEKILEVYFPPPPQKRKKNEILLRVGKPLHTQDEEVSSDNLRWQSTDHKN